MGTILNVVTILVGGGLGLFFGARLPQRVRETVLHGLGLFTIAIGLQMTLQSKNMLIVLCALLVGGVLGEWLNIDLALKRLGAWLEQRFAGGDAGSGRFIKGFVTAALVFNIGPMAILGSITDGLSHGADIKLLAIKSVLDGFGALAFASMMGVGVLFSAITVGIYQGLITLLAVQAQSLLTEAMIAEMTATGGILIVGIGVSSLLELKQIRVGNFLPALVIAPLVVAIVPYVQHLLCTAGICLGA